MEDPGGPTCGCGDQSRGLGWAVGGGFGAVQDAGSWNIVLRGGGGGGWEMMNREESCV